VLELGQEVGAAVIYTTAALDQAEIEIKAHDEEWCGHHTAVRKRPGPAAVYAALFFGLRQGTYELRAGEGGPGLTVHITGGRVTEATMTEWAACELDAENPAP
jgi:hypothetical protein